MSMNVIAYSGLALLYAAHAFYTLWDHQHNVAVEPDEVSRRLQQMRASWRKRK